MARSTDFETAFTRLITSAFVLFADAWFAMLTLGGLHSWDSRIPALPFWPLVGGFYLLGTVVGFLVFTVVTVGRTALEGE